MNSSIREKDFINAIRKGNKDVFSQLYMNYYDKLAKYIYSLSPDYKLAEDLAQDTLIDIWSKREKLHITTSLNNYLYRSAFNRFVNQQKKHLRKLNLIEELRIESIIELEGLEKDSKEARLIALENLIEKLPPKRKDIFVLCKLNNYKHKEIATMRNISVSTVESQIRKAMITIREEMLKLRLEGIISLLIALLHSLFYNRL